MGDVALLTECTMKNRVHFTVFVVARHDVEMGEKRTARKVRAGL